jgi:hypothetical protein
MLKGGLLSLHALFEHGICSLEGAGSRHDDELGTERGTILLSHSPLGQDQPKYGNSYHVRSEKHVHRPFIPLLGRALVHGPPWEQC